MWEGMYVLSKTNESVYTVVFKVTYLDKYAKNELNLIHKV